MINLQFLLALLKKLNLKERNGMLNMDAHPKAKAIIALLSLYAASQEQLYIAYSDKFKKLSDWLLEDEDISYMKLYPRLAPDVCGRCGIVFGKTFGGRVRDACPLCGGNAVFQNQLLRFWWPTMMDSIFNVHHEILEGYLAEALILYGEARNERARKSVG